MERRKQKMDMEFFIAIIVLILFGMAMVFSASWPSASMEFDNPRHYITNHLIYVMLGFIVMFIGSSLDYRIYKRWALPIFILTWIACLLVFSPLGSAQGTFARRWINIGGRTLMPSDFLKIGSIFAMAAYLDRHKAIKNPIRGTLMVVLFIVVIVAPIMLQPDFSTTITLTLTLMIMFFIAGMNGYHILPLIALAVFSFFTLMKRDTERLSRWLIYKDPLKDFYADGWQLSHSLFAASTGGFFGAGIGLSRQKYILSQAYNDFIFAIIGEELGFVGSLLLILLYVFAIYRGFVIAMNARDRFGALLAFGITALIGIQALVNIAVVLGMIPPTGIGLPFISYGGSSILCFMFLAGVLLNISKYPKMASEKRGA